MTRVIVAVVLAAVAQFAWGFTYHGLLSGMERMTARAPDEAAVAEALSKVLPASGTYMLPSCPGSHRIIPPVVVGDAILKVVSDTDIHW